METTETMFDYESPMADTILEPQKSTISTEGHEGNLTMTKLSPLFDEEPITLKWLDTSIENQ